MLLAKYQPFCLCLNVFTSTHKAPTSYTLRWRRNERDSVSNHQPHDCLLNRLFRRRSKKTSKLRVTGLCAGNSPGTGEFPAQMASNAENVSIWWRHHESYSWDILTWKQFPHYWYLCEGNPPVTCGFSSQRASRMGFDFFFMFVRTNCSTNSQVACDLRCHDAHVKSL